MSFTRGLIPFLAIASLVIPTTARADKIPDAVKAVLDKATEIELYSLDWRKPEEKPKEDFQGYVILGKTTVKDEETRKKIVAALAKGAEESKGTVLCFMPRHGLRAVHDGKKIDLVICVACLQTRVYIDDKKDEGYLTSASPKSMLDKILEDAKVPLAPKKK